MIHRALAPQVSADLEDKIVLLSGPRQSGKTTLARAILARASREAAERYLNWDDDEARTRILSGAFPHRGLVVFDELQKYGRWRNLLLKECHYLEDTEAVRRVSADRFLSSLAG